MNKRCCDVHLVKSIVDDRGPDVGKLNAGADAVRAPLVFAVRTVPAEEKDVA